jgi:hypothetical protein
MSVLALADVGDWIKENFGKCAGKYLYFAMMITGGGDEVGDMLAEKSAISSAFQSETIPPAIRKAVRDQTITQCGKWLPQLPIQHTSTLISMASIILAYTELLASIILLANTVTEMALDQPIITNGMDSAKRKEVIWTYLMILVFQVAALTLSHKVLKFKDKQYAKQHGNALPCNKKWHCFYSHKKELAHTEQWVISTKDSLWEHHQLRGFFDRDNLEEISQHELDESIEQSCSLLVFLDEKTLDSEWCVAEIKKAAECGLDIYAVVNNSYFTTRAMTDLWFGRERQTPFDCGPLGSTLFRYPVIEFSNGSRPESIERLARRLQKSTQRLLDAEALEFRKHAKEVHHGAGAGQHKGGEWKKAGASHTGGISFVGNPLRPSEIELTEFQTENPAGVGRLHGAGLHISLLRFADYDVFVDGTVCEYLQARDLLNMGMSANSDALEQKAHSALSVAPRTRASSTKGPIITPRTTTPNSSSPLSYG